MSHRVSGEKLLEKQAGSAPENPLFDTNPERYTTFFPGDLPGNSARQFAPFRLLTTLSTAPINGRKSLKNRISIHPQSTLNPQVLHVNISLRHTLGVGHPPGTPTKSSGAFSCPLSTRSLKGNSAAIVPDGSRQVTRAVTKHSESTSAHPGMSTTRCNEGLPSQPQRF